MTRHRGAVYQIERVPPELWRRAKARAALEGRPLREVVLELLRGYVAGTPILKPEPVPVMEDFRPSGTREIRPGNSSRIEDPEELF
jgi:hypothetical protein